MKMAGIDVHKKVLMVVVVDASAPEEKPARRRFVTMPSELHRLLMWQVQTHMWLQFQPHRPPVLSSRFHHRLFYSLLPQPSQRFRKWCRGESIKSSRPDPTKSRPPPTSTPA